MNSPQNIFKKHKCQFVPVPPSQLQVQRRARVHLHRHVGALQPGDCGQGGDPWDAGGGILRAGLALGLRGEQPDLELMLGHHNCCLV